MIWSLLPGRAPEYVQVNRFYFSYMPSSSSFENGIVWDRVRVQYVHRKPVYCFVLRAPAENVVCVWKRDRWDVVIALQVCLKEKSWITQRATGVEGGSSRPTGSFFEKTLHVAFENSTRTIVPTSGSLGAADLTASRSAHPRQLLFVLFESISKKKNIFEIIFEWRSLENRLAKEPRSHSPGDKNM